MKKFKKIIRGGKVQEEKGNENLKLNERDKERYKGREPCSSGYWIRLVFRRL